MNLWVNFKYYMYMHIHVWMSCLASNRRDKEIGEFPLGAVDEYTIYCIGKQKVYKVSFPFVVLLSPSNFSRPLFLLYTIHSVNLPSSRTHTKKETDTRTHTW